MLKLFMRMFGRIRWGWWPFWIMFNQRGYYVTGTQTDNVMRVIRPGDVLLRGYDQYPSSKLIGYWSHVAIVVDPNYVVHAISKGVVEEHIIDFCRCDRIFVLRPELNERELADVIKIAKSNIGKPYDFYFLFNDPREVSCVELFYSCFDGFHKRLGFVTHKIPIFGDTLVPNDILNFNFIRVYRTDK